MLTAQSPEQKSETPQAAEQAQAPHSSVWAASELDAPAASPVHAMQASLSRRLDGAPRGFDPTWLIVMAFNATCWWGLISLALVMVHVLGRH
jgi:hypothetical protein